MPQTMQVYWQDGHDIVESTHPKPMTLVEALNRWADGSGAEDNFFGMIDADDNTMQFYFEDSIPDDVDDGSHLAIVLVDFPIPALGGSYQKMLTIGETPAWIKRGFEVGLNHEKYEGLLFAKW